MSSPETPKASPKGGPALVRDHGAAETLRKLSKEAESCRRCGLYKDATQVVFGAGPSAADLVLVGEQPGDMEDKAGEPFVGPAGRLLDRALEEAGIDRTGCYVTNAVKHFKFFQRGKRRMHSRPNAGEVKSCAWWLGAELGLIQPKLVVALGATALYSLLGRGFSVSALRGSVCRPDEAPPVLVTVHPAFVLRRHAGEAEFSRMVADLKEARSFLRGTRTE